jgi:signal transduction histidine kinase
MTSADQVPTVPVSSEPDAGVTALRVLVVDDDESDRRAVYRCLRLSGIRAVADEASMADEVIDRIGRVRYDCVLLDYYLPGIAGLALLERVRAAAPDTPVVIFTGRGDEEIAVELMKGGAADYLPKASLTPERLAASLRHTTQLARTAAARRRAEAERERLLEREQDARARAERASYLRDEVLAIVAHDLRSPLHTIAIASAMLDVPLPEEERRRQVEAIRRSTERMNVLISDLLDATSIEVGSLSIQRGRVDVAALLAEARELFERQARPRGLQLECDVAADVPPVDGDRGRLMQVISNLIGNSLKFTDAGGAIRLRSHAESGAVEISVEDSGRGIAPEHLPHVFDRFWRADREARTGAGLGLAIAKGIVEAHGGRIWAESTLGRGTTIHFTVPVSRDPVSRGPDPAPAE